MVNTFYNSMRCMIPVTSPGGGGYLLRCTVAYTQGSDLPVGDDLRGGDIGQLSLGRFGRRVSGDESSQTGLSFVLSSVWLGEELALTVADNRLFHRRSFTDLMSPMGHNGTGGDSRMITARAPRCPNDCSTTGPLSPGGLLDISGVITPMPDGDNV